MFKKKTKVEDVQIPRQLEEIRADYEKVAANAGKVQYQILVLKQTLDGLNGQLNTINQEANTRQELDKKTEPKAEETK